MKRTTLYAILGAAAIAAVAGVFLLRECSAAQPEEETRSAIVERGTMRVAVSASGSVEPQARVSLEFEGTDRVAEVNVEMGDAVEEGDVLAWLDTRQLELQVQQAQASLKLAEVQLTELQAGPQPEDVEAAEANLEAAQAQVSAAAANRDDVEAGPTDAQIAAAEANLASAKLQHKVALDTYLRIQTMEKWETEQEQTQYELHIAENALAAAQAELDDLLAGADADEVRSAQANVEAAAAQADAAQARLDLLLAGATAEQIADAAAQVAQAEAALELAELALKHATLHAPFDGIVAEVNVEAGEMAPAGMPAITLLDASKFHVTVSVDEIDVGRLAKGQAAQVMLDALPDVVIDGTVERIASVADFEGGVVYYEVTIALAPTKAPARADMTASATIEVEELTDVLMIPTWVVRVDRTTGQTYVHRQVGDDVERVDVELGVRYEGAVEVLGGLSEGDEIIWVRESNGFGFGGQE
jgi:HlyD family secretion protein